MHSSSPPSRRRRLNLRVWGLSAALLLPLAGEAQTVHQHTRSVVENRTVDLDVLGLFPGDVDPQSVVVAEEPRHGSLPQIPFGFTYRPTADYFGVDDVTFEGTLANGETHTVDLRFWVLPRVLPIAGVFDASYYGAPGFYDLVDREFILCSPWASGGVVARKDPGAQTGDPFTFTLSCERYSVTGAEIGWIPVVGDWFGEGRDLIPSLFDPSTGTLYRLIPGKKKHGLRIAPASMQVDGARWTWPVAGDWEGTGLDSLALYHQDGTVMSVHNLASGSARALGTPVYRTWPAPLPHSGDQDKFPFPYAVHSAGTDVLALNDGLWWRTLGSNGAFWEMEFVQIFPGIPVNHRHWGIGDYGALAFTRSGGTFWLRAVNDMNPQTIALKFHNDPPDP